MQPSNTKWSHILQALLATSLWGSAFAGAKIGFEYMPPMMLSGFRFMLAGLLLVPMIPLMRISWRAELKHWRFMLLFGFMQTFMQYGFFYMGLNLVPAATSAIVIGAGPLFIAVMAHFALPNDKLNLRKIFAVLLGIAGVVSISFTGDSFSDSSPLFYRGIVLLVISNIVGSYTNIMVVKKKNAQLSPVALTLFANFVGGFLLLLVSLFIEPTEVLFEPLPAKFYFALVWLAIIPAAGFSLWYHLLAQPGVKVSELNIWKFVVPVVGVVLSWCLLPDEYPTWSTVIGIVIISLSVLILQLPQRK